MGNSASVSAWSSTYTEIKTQHDAAYAVIQNAISLEEEEKPNEAIEKYKEGIQFIDKALRIQVTCPANPDFTWERAVVMIQKMKKTRGEVLSRITCIQKSNQTFESREQPPSYEEAMASTPVETPQTYNDLANALEHMTVKSNVTMEAEVMYMYENVKLYFISPDGEVSSTLKPQTLKITLVESNNYFKYMFFCVLIGELQMKVKMYLELYYKSVIGFTRSFRECLHVSGLIMVHLFYQIFMQKRLVYSTKLCES
jgi:spartin